MPKVPTAQHARMQDKMRIESQPGRGFASSHTGDVTIWNNSDTSSAMACYKPPRCRLASMRYVHVFYLLCHILRFLPGHFNGGAAQLRAKPRLAPSEGAQGITMATRQSSSAILNQLRTQTNNRHTTQLDHVGRR